MTRLRVYAVFRGNVIVGVEAAREDAEREALRIAEGTLAEGTLAEVSVAPMWALRAEDGSVRLDSRIWHRG